MNISNTKGQSIMMASVAHNTLAKIISHILRDLYSIRPPSLPVRVALSTKYSEDLLNWRRSLSRFLDADGFDHSLLIPLFQRQRNVLNLAYYHALILIHRPFLLSNFASLNHSRSGPRGALGTTDIDKNVIECLNAAIHIASIVNELTEGQQIYRAFWVPFSSSFFILSLHISILMFLLTSEVHSLLRILRRRCPLRARHSATRSASRPLSNLYRCSREMPEANLING